MGGVDRYKSVYAMTNTDGNAQGFECPVNMVGLVSIYGNLVYYISI